MQPEKTEHRKLTAIMFTDMVGYSALAQRNEALALELLEEHRRLLRPIFLKHNGREVETAGDAFLVEFVSALEAVRCAVEIQEHLSERNKISPPERSIRLRIGIHVGDVVHKDGKVMGDAVNIAARIEPLAPAGGICISEDVARSIHNKLPNEFIALERSELKNIELPVKVFRVAMPWETKGKSKNDDSTKKLKLGLVTCTVILVAAASTAWFADHYGNFRKQATGPSTASTNAALIGWKPPELPATATNIVCYFGSYGMGYRTEIGRLRTNRLDNVFVDQTKQLIPFKPILEMNRLYIHVDAVFGSGTILMNDETIKSFRLTREFWDWNFNTNQYEIVRLGRTANQDWAVPVLQVAYVSATEIMIKGLLNWGTNRMMIAFPNQMHTVDGISNWTTQIKAKPIFKYPSFSHRGELAE